MCASKLLSNFLIWKPQELLWSLQISLLAVHLPSRIACSLRSLLISFSDSVFTEIISQSEQRCAISEPRFISVIPMKSQVAWLRFLCLWHPFACQATISSSLFLPMTGSFRPSTYCSSQKSERVVQYDRATQNRVMRLCVAVGRWPVDVAGNVTDAMRCRVSQKLYTFQSSQLAQPASSTG